MMATSWRHCRTCAPDSGTGIAWGSNCARIGLTLSSEGPFGPSMVVDPHAFSWRIGEWPGAVPRHRQVVYELHIGTFTRGGMWTTALERLAHLASVGVTTLEVMPIAEFDGRFGWGYDGVSRSVSSVWHAGRCRTFVDAAHAAGLGVILDVVYNHLGPSGNVLRVQQVLLRRTCDGMGPGSIWMGCSAPVRHFMRENVRHWLQMRFDGLRFDATQALIDRSPTHIVHELTNTAVHRLRRVQSSSARRTNRGHPARASRRDRSWSGQPVERRLAPLSGRRAHGAPRGAFSDYLGSAQEFASMARWNLL